MLRSDKSRATAVPLNLNNLSTNDDLLRTNHGAIMESVDHRHPGPRQSGRAEPEPYELTSAIALEPNEASLDGVAAGRGDGRRVHWSDS